MHGDTAYKLTTLMHDLDSPSEFHSDFQAFRESSTTGKPFDPDQLSREEEMTFVSQYLNLDYGTSPSTNHAAGAGTGSPTAFSQYSTSFTGSPGDAEVQLGTEPTSLSLLDATKFEAEVDANGIETRNPWPWGNYTYRPPGRPRYIDSAEYVREYEFTKIEDRLRIRLTEFFAEKAVRAGTKPEVEKRGEGGKSEGTSGEASAPIYAFSQVIRGRTIYNP